MTLVYPTPYSGIQSDLLPLVESQWNYRPLPAPTPITEQNWPKTTRPLVTIRCIAYNQEPYVKTAIDSFLMQETNFPVNIVVHDDASTDRTPEILRKYEERHPNLFICVLQQKNLYQLGVPVDLSAVTHGKYSAICDGDDYWTDPTKLQRQIDFLENNPEIVISGHDAFVADEADRMVAESNLPNSFKRNFSSNEMQDARAWIQTSTMVYRNVLPMDTVPEMRFVKNKDTFRVAMLGKFGSSKYHTDIGPTCYRQLPGGIWSLIPKSEKQNDIINLYFWLYRYWNRVGDDEAANACFNFWARKALSMASYSQIRQEVLGRLLIYRAYKKVSSKLMRVGRH